MSTSLDSVGEETLESRVEANQHGGIGSETGDGISQQVTGLGDNTDETLDVIGKGVDQLVLRDGGRQLDEEQTKVGDEGVQTGGNEHVDKDLGPASKSVVVLQPGDELVESSSGLQNGVGDRRVELGRRHVLESLDGGQEQRDAGRGEALEDVEESNPVLGSSGVEGNSLVNKSLGDLGVSSKLDLSNVSKLDETGLLVNRSGSGKGQSSHGGESELGERDHCV